MDMKSIAEEMAAFGETKPSLVLPDLTAEPLPDYRTLAQAGLLFSGPRSMGNHALRDMAVSTYGYALPCREAIDACVSLSPILEVGAGVGFWAHLIARAGGDVVATDIEPPSIEYLLELDADLVEELRHTGLMSSSKPWHPVEAMDAVQAVTAYPGRTVLMIWPSYDEPWAAEVLDAMAPGQTLIHVGELGETSGDARFAEMLGGDGFERVDRVFVPTWPGLSDDMTVWRKTA